MSAVVRASRLEDIEALYEMAKLAGAGFTNLPADRDVLAGKLARSQEAFRKTSNEPGDDQYVLIMEHGESGKVIGTAQIFSQIGTNWPFYSYRLSTLSQNSRELGRIFKAEMLTLTTDYEGCSEVGGLFLHPRERAGGLGMLLARSRYLFIRQHRTRFANRLLAELRGMIDEAGASPFWDGLAGKFFGMTFQEADTFNSTRGNQFIADLMPKHPIYTAMLPENARLAMGRPHPNGRAAMRMLEEEGFRYESYIDIFDGGPTMIAETDRIRSIAQAREAELMPGEPGEGVASIMASGSLLDFRACIGQVEQVEAGIVIDRESARLLDVMAGAEIVHVAR
jgi:arginine N-succinyltransferase